jgi:hypothetical protein
LEGCLSAHLQAEEMVEEADIRAIDEMHSSAVRHYFTTAPATGTRANEKHERSKWLRQPGSKDTTDSWQISRSIFLR